MANLSVKLNTGAEMPLIGLGTWQAAPGVVGQAVADAIEIGYKHIDCAACYGNEAEIGATFKSIFEKGDVKRSDIFVTSKLWNSEHEPKYVRAACEQTLKDLQLDYLDLYLIHWPHAFAKVEGSTRGFPRDKDNNIIYGDTHFVDTYLEMEKLVEAGLVKAIGVSNFNSKQLTELMSKTSIVPATNQVESHPFFTNDELVKFCKEKTIQVTAYSPLGTGSNIGGHTIPTHPLLKEIGAKYNKSAAQIALAWMVSRKIPTFPKSVHKDRILANSEVDVPLTEDDLAKIATLAVGNRVCWAGPLVERNGKMEPRDFHHPHYPFEYPPK